MKNKEVKQLIETNKQVVQVMEYLQGQYEFSEEEKETVDLLKKHMENLNIIFAKIKK